jgi:hypothetical protein
MRSKDAPASCRGKRRDREMRYWDLDCSTRRVADRRSLLFVIAIRINRR